MFLPNTPCIPIDLGNSQGLEGQGLINDFSLQSYYKVDVAKQLGGGFAKIHPMAGHQHRSTSRQVVFKRHISTFKTFLIFLEKRIDLKVLEYFFHVLGQTLRLPACDKTKKTQISQIQRRGPRTGMQWEPRINEF